MKTSLSFLPLGLSLFGLSLAGVLEDHGYKLNTEDHAYGVISPQGLGLNAIEFYPQAKVVSIYMARNDQEPEHENRLSLAEIFTVLCEKEQMSPDDISWLSFDVDHDPKADAAIRLIRDHHNKSPQDDVKLLPGQQGWDSIAATKYYRMMQQLINKPVQKILVRNFYQKNYLRQRFPANSIHFSFSSPEGGVPGAEAGSPFDGIEEQRAVLKALFAEDEEN